LYTFRFRSILYPALENFDATKGEISCVRRVRSNTPLQALTTLNETLFVEASRELAKRTMAEGGEDDDARLTYLVRRCLARDASSEELAVLEEFVKRQKERFHAEGADPWPLAAEKKPENGKLPGDLNAVDLAAWTAVARVVLNLDETITKE
jgi:hypothetical protein